MEPQSVMNSLPIKYGNNHVTGVARRKATIKKAITYHLAGLGEKSGLVYKALEKAAEWLDSGDVDRQGKAMDVVIKLLPYVVEKEGVISNASIGPNGTGVINVQINNFDSFLKDRLSQTNLGKLLSTIDLQQSPRVNNNIEEAKFEDLTPPPTPGGNPVRGEG